MKYIAQGAPNVSFPIQHPTNSSSINPDAASARGAITVGAVRWTDPGLDTPEPGSSSRERRFLLRKETLRDLSAGQLRQVVGASARSACGYGSV